MSETIRVIQPGKRRVKIFIDFWNVLINARKQTTEAFDIRLRWDSLASSIVRETSGGHSDETTSEQAGCYIFGSYVKSDPRQQRLIDEVLDEYGSCPGLFFNFSERVKKETSIKCKKCNTNVDYSSESGVDVLLCVEMIKHASMREHEYLALVSNDRDFLPMLAFLKDKGERVIHAVTGDKQREMRAITWKQIDLKEQYAQHCQISNEERIILTEPKAHEKLAQAIDVMQENSLPHKVIDITNVNDICDRDLDFILKNQMIFFKEKEKDPKITYSARRVARSMSLLRQGILSGAIIGNLPYVFHKSRLEARADDQWNWVVAGDHPDRWKKYRAGQR